MQQKRISSLNPLSYIFIACIIINILVSVFVILVINNIQPVVPLFYGKPQGAEQLVPRNFLIIPPLLASFIAIFDLIIANTMKDEFLKKILVGIVVAVTALAVIAVFKTYFLIV